MFKQDKAAVQNKTDLHAETNFRKMIGLLTPSQTFTAVSSSYYIPHLLNAFSKLVKEPQEKTPGQVWNEAANQNYVKDKPVSQQAQAKTPSQILSEAANPYATNKTASTDKVGPTGESDFKKMAKFILGK